METLSLTSDLYSKALSLERDSKYDEAIALYESIIDIDETKIGSYIRLGELYESNNLIIKAISTYKKGIVLAQKLRNKKAERFLSYILLGLIE